MTNLTPAQQTVLEAAIKRADGSIHPLPAHIKGGAAKKVVEALRAKNLIDDAGRLLNDSGGLLKPPANEPPAHGPGPDFSDDAVVQAWNDNMPAEDAAYHEEMNAASEEPEGPDDYDDPPRSLFCPMDPADLPPANSDAAPADGDFEEDVNAAEQALAEATDHVAEIIRDIAKQHLNFEGDLVNFYGNDGFMSAGFPWDSIRQALFAAYQAGLNATKSPRKKASPQAKVKTPRENSKQAQVIALLRQPEGTTIEQISEATNWNANTVRGAMAGALKKKLGLNVVRMPHTAGEKSSYRIED